MSMKEFIIQHAYRRSDNPVPGNAEDRPAPDAVIVAYNGAPDGLCSSDNPGKRSPMGITNNASLVSRQDDSEVDIVVDGNVVATNWIQSYCAATAGSSAQSISSTSSISATASDSTTASDPPTSSDSTTASGTHSDTMTQVVPIPSLSDVPIYSEPPAAPAPTINIAQGILTCGTKTYEDEDAQFFSLDEMAAARDAFCSDVTNREPRVVFKPGETHSVDHVYSVPSNTDRRVRVSANWDAAPDSECKTFRFASNAGLIGAGNSGLDICERRVDVPIQNCKFSAQAEDAEAPADHVLQVIPSKAPTSSGNKAASSFGTASRGRLQLRKLSLLRT